MTNQEPQPRAWPHLRPPPRRSCSRWTPEHLADLPRIRREFRSRVTNPAQATQLDDDQVIEATAALDELMSNALRHGRAPVQVEVCDADHGLLLLVGDRATTDPPQPTATRDPALGGMGLGMVATTANAYGWFTDHDVKTVWALIPHRRPDHHP